MKRLRKIASILLVIVLAVLVLWRLKRQFVPAGAKAVAFLFASTPQDSTTSPNGRKVFYRFNDAGAAHSGFHYTWCYTSHWLTGKKVIAAGFSEPSVRTGEEPFPWHWHEDGKDFSVRFAGGRHDSSILWLSGRIP